MSITHVAAIRNSQANAAVDPIDVGTTDLTGDLVLMSAGDVEVATLNFANPAYGDGGASVTGRADSNVIADDTNATGGLLGLFMTQNRDNAECWRGTITGIGGGGDIEASNTTVSPGDTVQCTGINYSAAP